MGRLTKCVCPRFVLLFLTALSAGSVRVQGQSANTPSVPAARPQTIEQPSTRNQIRVRANEVVAPVSVTDKTGERPNVSGTRRCWRRRHVADQINLSWSRG